MPDHDFQEQSTNVPNFIDDKAEEADDKGIRTGNTRKGFGQLTIQRKAVVQTVAIQKLLGTEEVPPGNKDEHAEEEDVEEPDGDNDEEEEEEEDEGGKTPDSSSRPAGEMMVHQSEDVHSERSLSPASTPDVEASNPVTNPETIHLVEEEDVVAPLQTEQPVRRKRKGTFVEGVFEFQFL